MNHTKEPWAYYPNGEIHTQENAIKPKQPYSAIAFAPDYENARRIVACVNACLHTSTDDLEYGINEMYKSDANLIKQRDELLAALKMWVIAAQNPEVGAYVPSEVKSAIRAAINNAESES